MWSCTSILGVSILPYSAILIFYLELFQLCGFLLFFNSNFIICSFETHSVVKDVVIPYLNEWDFLFDPS
jgi:hypothetical protein